MVKVVNLIFSGAGVLNPSQIKVINGESDPVDVIIFGDGSSAAFSQIEEFAKKNDLLPNKVNKFGLGLSPLYDLRVINRSGEVSLPNYVYDYDTKVKWFCAQIAAPHLEILLSDVTSISQTQVKVDDDLKTTICYKSYTLWKMLQVIESQLDFPAVVIDKMTRWTQKLTPNTIDIDLLRKETGIESLDYNSTSDLLSIVVNDDIHTVKLSLLNDVYKNIILRQFNALFGRRLRISVSIINSSGVLTDPVDVSYGELGRIIDGMDIYTKVTTITDSSPMKPQDLIAFVKRVEINEHTCIWVEPGQSLLASIQSNKDQLVR